jgi:hypothetical protein
MAAITNKALAVRAVRIATFLEHAADQLHDELKQQGMNVTPRPISSSEKTALSRRLINDLVIKMWEITADIRRFDPPKRPRR